jgi:predicted AAA+ superfamily ATPase
MTGFIGATPHWGYGSLKTTDHYLDFFVDSMMVRRLQPYLTNLPKRLVKSPKTYLRDSGILHALLNIESIQDLQGHPIVGAS